MTMTTITTDPRFLELGERLIKILSAINRQAARTDVDSLDPFATSEISKLAYDALVATERIQLLTGFPVPDPAEPPVSRMNDLELVAGDLVELVETVGAELDLDVQMAIASIARVLDGVQRYAQLA